MSGGKFDHKQYQINDIADTIEREINKSGRRKTKEEIKNDWHDEEWYKMYPEDLCFYKYPDEVIDEFKNGVNILRKAAIYAHRIDYLLSGDDGNESFLERLKNELSRLENASCQSVKE
jgi:hypothetical protein